MATSSKGSWFPGRGRDRERTRLRVLTAAATRLKLDNKKEAAQMKGLRQGWQSVAWDYRDKIGELRYAVSFLANCTARMKLYPAAYASSGEDDSPQPLSEIENVPSEVVDACREAMEALGNGRMAISGLLHSASTNDTVAGEAYLLGREDPLTGRDEWSIRSVNEIEIREDRYQLREAPTTTTAGGEGWEDLDPTKVVVSRIWTPHPRFRILADSAMRAILDECESLMILRRMIRATGRSRLAGRGILLLPEELTIKQPNDDDEQEDPFLAELTDAMVTPIDDEGVASAAVPLVVRGPADMLDKVRHLDFASTFDAEASKTRTELIGVIATGLDLPKEIVEGVADLNHWSAWQVDDNTFRHHVEPHVIRVCDGLTGAYLRPFLEAANVPDEWVQRALLWYDPTELVTHPDQTKDALDLHDRLTISNKALLQVTGFNEEDAPDQAEFMVRLLHNMRNWPPNVVMAALHALDPTLTIPPILQSGTIPGVKPSGVDTAAEDGIVPGQTTPGTPMPRESAGAPPPAAPPAQKDPSEGGTPPEPITAAGGRAGSRRLSRRLVAIDSDLRTKLQTAANAAMLRELERAGARLRSAAKRDETLRTAIAQVPNKRAAAVAGKRAIAAAGIDPEALMEPQWSDLRSQFMGWTASAQENALKTALSLGELDDASQAAVNARAAMAVNLDEAWNVLENSLTHLGQHLLYDPNPNTIAGEFGDVSPDTLVPTGIVRAALGVAGGASRNDLGVDAVGNPTIPVGEAIGQVGTGSTVQDLLTSAGAEVEQYEWVHGPALRPFEPHEALDGVIFANFDASVLANDGDWPANGYFFPGDHAGCLCDFMPMWVPPSEAAEESDESSPSPEEGEGA